MKNEEAMGEILSDMGISLTDQQIKELSDAFTTHLELEHEIQSHRHFGHKEECSECKKLKSELQDMKRQRDVYHKSVCQRRNTDDVWIEGDTVMFRP